MNAVKDDVIALVHKELESANKQFPLFNSAHEGYAVLLEEIEEAEEEIRNARMYLDALWHSIKNNRNDAITDRFVLALKASVINLAIEAIQVAAMAQKLIDSAKDPVAEKLGEIIEREEKRIE